MIRHSVWTAVLVTAMISGAQARVFLVGSNPSLTILAFPQDIFKFKDDFLFYFLTYENKPWWGDIDDPPNKPMNESPNRPNNTYLATGEKYGPDENGYWFKHESFIRAIQNHIGFSRTFSPRVKSRFDLRYSAWPMRTRASGKLGALAFDYEAKNSCQEAYLNSILGFMVRDVPVGIKIGLGGFLSGKPELNYQISTNGASTESSQLYWGWSALQGGSVFDVPDSPVHAAEQNEYSVGPLYEVDFQAGSSWPRLHMGTRLRYHWGNLRTYRRDGTQGYLHDATNQIRNMTVRFYGNKIWREEEKFRFATLVLTRLTRLDSTEVDVDNPDVQNGHERMSRNFVLQINPNISLYPWRTRQTYIDAAILCNYSYIRYENTGPVWVSGGQTRSYRNTNVYVGDEYSWENCSYANENFFEVALDLNPVFPIFGNREQSVALGTLIMLWTRFKWRNKYYGSNNVSGSEAEFVISNIRKNFEHEAWLNSAFNLIYRRKGFIYRLDIAQPLIYSLTPRTRVVSEDGKTVLYEKRLENMWVSQSGVRLGFFITTTFENLRAMRYAMAMGD